MVFPDNCEYFSIACLQVIQVSHSFLGLTKNLIRSEKEKYNKTVNALVSETFYFSIIFFSAIWFVSPNPFTSISYLLGALLGTAYCYGLGKYVETLGGSAYDAEDLKGSGKPKFYQPKNFEYLEFSNNFNQKPPIHFAILCFLQGWVQQGLLF